MEKKAYLTARKDFCIEQRKDKRIAMYELFDMISGSETGAIIAATLVSPLEKNEKSSDGLKNKYWATKAASFFKENVDLLYVDTKMPESLKGFLTILFLMVVGCLSYKTAEAYFKNDGKSIQITEIKKLLKMKKKNIKKQNINSDEIKKCQDDCEKLMAKEEELMIITIFKEVAQVDSTDPSKLDVLF